MKLQVTWRASGVQAAMLIIGGTWWFALPDSALAAPSFAAKFRTIDTNRPSSCPRLNPLGAAFRRNGGQGANRDVRLISDSMKSTGTTCTWREMLQESPRLTVGSCIGTPSLSSPRGIQ